MGKHILESIGGTGMHYREYMEAGEPSKKVDFNPSFKPWMDEETQALHAQFDRSRDAFMSQMRGTALSTVEKWSESDLTDEERAAILFCAGVPYDYRDGKMVFRPSGITKVDGKWMVGYREEPVTTRPQLL